MEISKTAEPETTFRKFVMARIKSSFWDQPQQQQQQTLRHRIPPVRLCEIAKKKIAIEKENSVWADWGCVLKIYELTKRVRTEHLDKFLSPFSGEYSLKWIDDNNALVYFASSERADEAFEVLNKKIVEQRAGGGPAPGEPLYSFKIAKVEKNELGGSAGIIGGVGGLGGNTSNNEDMRFWIGGDDAGGAFARRNGGDSSLPKWLQERKEMQNNNKGMLQHNPLLQKKKKRKPVKKIQTKEADDKDWNLVSLSNPWNILSQGDNNEGEAANNNKNGSDSNNALIDQNNVKKESWLDLAYDLEQREKERQEKEAETKWSCNACTFLNEKFRTHCAVCETVKGGK